MPALLSSGNVFVYDLASATLVTTIAFAVCTTVKVSITSFTDLGACFDRVKVYEPLKSGIIAALAIIDDRNSIKAQAEVRTIAVTCITSLPTVAINPHPASTREIVSPEFEPARRRRSEAIHLRCDSSTRDLFAQLRSRMLFDSHGYETDGKFAGDYGPAFGRVADFAG
jgi:hypothetical protein